MRALIAPVRAWARLYTARLDTAEREARRAEIECDLWEQARSAMNEGRHPMVVVAEIWARCLAGIADDVLWRLERSAASRARRQGTEGRQEMTTIRSRRSLALPIGAIAVAIGVALVLITIDNIQYLEQSERIVPSATLASISGVLLVAALACIPVGFLAMRRRPVEGAALVVGGALTAGLMVYWLIVPVLLAVAISWYGIRRARRFAAAGDRG